MTDDELAAIKAAHTADADALHALQPHAQVIHTHRVALLAEVDRLRADAAYAAEREWQRTRLREMLESGR